jgi:hypothetical protein
MCTVAQFITFVGDLQKDYVFSVDNRDRPRPYSCTIRSHPDVARNQTIQLSKLSHHPSPSPRYHAIATVSRKSLYFQIPCHSNKEKSCGGVVAITSRESLARGINCQVTKLIGKVAGSSPAHGLSLLVGDEDAIHKHGYSFCRLFVYIEMPNTTETIQGYVSHYSPGLGIAGSPPYEFPTRGTHKEECSCA